MVLMVLSTITMSQENPPPQNMMTRFFQLLDYLAMHTDAKIRFYASDIIMNIHSDASYLSKSKADSRACGHFFHGMETG
jgi:hypothetical protein